jgi:hypothetical protein
MYEPAPLYAVPTPVAVPGYYAPVPVPGTIVQQSYYTPAVVAPTVVAPTVVAPVVAPYRERYHTRTWTPGGVYDYRYRRVGGRVYVRERGW